MYVLVLFVSSLSLSTAYAQSKVQANGSDLAFSQVVTTDDSGYIISGTIGNDGLLLKIDSLDSVTWGSSFGRWGLSENLIDVIQTQDGGFIATGEYTVGYQSNGITPTAIDIFVVRTDGSGNMLWNTQINKVASGLYTAGSIIELSDGGFMITAQSTWGSTINPVVVKINSIGDVVWMREISSDLGHYMGINKIQEVDSNQFILSGAIGDGFSGNWDIIAIWTDAQGNLIRNRLVDFTNTDVPTDIEGLDDGGFIISGWSTTNTMNLTKINSVGDVEWAYKYSAPLQEGFLSIKGVDDGILLGCEVYNDDIGAEKYLCIFKIDFDGSILWTKGYGDLDENDTRLNGITELGDKSIVAVGFVEYLSGEYSGYIINADSIGNTICPEYVINLVKDTLTYLNDSTPLQSISRTALEHDYATVQVNINGFVKQGCVITDIESVNGNEDYAPFKLVPNPMTDQTVIRIEGNSSMYYKIKVFDTMGRVISEINNVSSGTIIERKSLPSGIYYVRLYAANVPSLARKLLVQ
ncbi:MAG: T9SS type A sorting domain-containing protein [Flavobacteriales bacterium]|nr:T9SS type A sorting domain-containing protein [Flavobacteriales bacterium]